ncbi:MAG: alpha/beta hydrolase [Gammaproteobacteria bacterium]|nr:alpha/beta hydrolase [Gammaproteobacteria bacterium]
MPTFDRAGVCIYYEEHGAGTPVLLIAPGGMKSAISFWASTPWNPIEQLSGQYRVVAMDQRNAGQSSAPVTADDGWHTYTDDHLALMDHLNIDRFHVAGMCIGGPYCLGLIARSASRILSATLFQTIGRDDNRQAFYDMFDGWADDLKASMGVSEEVWSSFKNNMYGGDKVLFNVDEAFVTACTTPLLVLMGNDLYHPQSSSQLIAQSAPNVELIEDWKEGAAREIAKQKFLEFLNRHS